MNSNSNIKNKTIKNIIWRFAERCGAQGISFIVSIILARLLAPEDYGVIAIVTVFITILQVFVDSGLGSALIQKKDADDLDFSTVFYFNIFWCCILYIGIFIISPYIAAYFNTQSLTSVIRVLSLTIVISGVKNIQQAFVSKKMIFKKFFFSTLIGTICSAIVGLFLAYKGYGVWALVVQQVLNSTIDTCILWITVKWRPKLQFSFVRLKGLFSYGWKLLLSTLINTIYNEVRQLIIGKMYSPLDLAYYNRGKQFPNFIVANINTSIDSVLLSAMAEYQNDKERIKSMTRRSIMISSYIMWPLMFGLMAIGEPLIKLILTEKWIQCVPYMYIFCFICGMQPIHTSNLNAIKAIGCSGLYLKMEIIKKSIGIIIILISAQYGVFAIGIGSVIYTLIASIINAYPNRQLLDYSYFEQVRDILPSFLLAFIMGIIVYFVPLICLTDYLVIPTQIVVGIIIYLLGSIALKLDCFYFLVNTMKNMKSINLNH